MMLPDKEAASRRERMVYSSDFGVWFLQRTGLPEELPMPSETRLPSCTSSSRDLLTHTGHKVPRALELVVGERVNRCAAGAVASPRTSGISTLPPRS